MLNLLIFCPNALENGRGGELSSIELASGLQKYFQVTFFDTNIITGQKLLSKEAIEKKMEGVKKRFRIKFATINILNRTFTFPYPWEVIKLFKTIKRMNIIYSSLSSFKFDLIFILFSLLNRRARYIIGYRKPLHTEKFFSFYNIKYRISILFYSLFKKKFYHHTISQHAKRFLHNFYDPKKVNHIIHGINLDDYIDNGKEKKREDLISFIYVGHLDDIHKGVGILLNGIKKFLEENKNLKIFFEFCGKGPLESNIKELEKRFPRYIRYNGYLNSNDLIDAYKRNDIFLFSSRREPFGRVIIEALAANLVILCSKTIGSIEILKGRDFAFFLPELSPQAICEKILELYNLWKENPKKIKELQNNAKQFALQNYTVSKEIEKFYELIKKINNNKI